MGRFLVASGIAGARAEFSWSGTRGTVFGTLVISCEPFIHCLLGIQKEKVPTERQMRKKSGFYIRSLSLFVQGQYKQ